MQRRFAIVTAATILAVTGVTGLGSAFADETGLPGTPEVPDAPAPNASVAASSYWACVAVDHVHVGACLSNPLPDPATLGPVLGTITRYL